MLLYVVDVTGKWRKNKLTCRQKYRLKHNELSDIWTEMYISVPLLRPFWESICQ